VFAPPCRRPLRIQGDAIGSPVQETAQGRLFAQASGILGQNKKRGLEGVLGVLLMSEHTPAYAFDYRPIAMNERGKGGFIAAHDESVQ
jgi:hypothetical protein